MNRAIRIMSAVLTVLFLFSACSKTDGDKARETGESERLRQAREQLEKKLAAGKPDQFVRMDLHVASLCRYAKQAESAIIKVKELFGDNVELRVYYINRLDGKGNLGSMFGEEGLEEDLRQACIQKNYPDRFFEYLKIFNGAGGKMTFEEIAGKAGIPADEINACAHSSDGGNILIENAVKNKTIRRSPTLFINGVQFEENITSFSVYKKVCSIISHSACEKVPDVVSDLDGLNSVSEGCEKEEEEEEEEKPPAPTADYIKHYVIKNESPFTNMKKIIKATFELFPDLDVEYIDSASEKGREFIRKYDIKYLPAYIFSENVVSHPSFEKIKHVVMKIGDGYRINSDAVKSSVSLDRSVEPGRLEIFISGLSQKGNTILKKIIEEVPGIEKKGIVFHYRIVKDKGGNYIALRGKPELEENIRRMIIERHFPDRLFGYLKERAKDFESSYWEDAVTAAGLDPKRIRELARDKATVEDMLTGELDWMLKRNIDGDIAIYINNNEAVYFTDEEELDSFISFLNRRGARP